MCMVVNLGEIAQQQNSRKNNSTVICFLLLADSPLTPFAPRRHRTLFSGRQPTHAFRATSPPYSVFWLPRTCVHGKAIQLRTKAQAHNL